MTVKSMSTTYGDARPPTLGTEGPHACSQNLWLVTNEKGLPVLTLHTRQYAEKGGGGGGAGNTHMRTLNNTMGGGGGGQEEMYSFHKA